MLLLESYLKTATQFSLKNIPLETIVKLKWVFLNLLLKLTKIVVFM